MCDAISVRSMLTMCVVSILSAGLCACEINVYPSDPSDEPEGTVFYEHGYDVTPDYASPDDIVSGPDLIVIGAATEVLDERSLYQFYPFDSIDIDRVTDLNVDVRRVLFDADDRMAGSTEVVLRVLRGATIPVIDKEYLFILRFNDSEPGDTFSAGFGLRDMLYWDGEAIRHADEEDASFAFGMTLDELGDSILAAGEGRSDG